MLLALLMSLAFIAVALVLIGFIALLTDSGGPPGAWWTFAMVFFIPVTYAADVPHNVLVANFVALGGAAVFWIFDGAFRVGGGAR